MPTTSPPLRDEARAAIEVVTTALQDAVRQELEALRASMQAHLVTLDRVVTPENMQPTFEPIVEHLCATVDQRLERVQADLEDRLQHAENAAAAARRDADAAAAQLAAARAQLDDVRVRVETLEKDKADLILQRDIDAAHLEGEVHNRTALSAALESARAQVLQAKADANALRLELQRAAAPQRENGKAAGSAPASERGALALEHIRSGLQTLARAAAGQELLAAGLELLSEHFPRVALCTSGPQGVSVWRSRGFDRPLESRKGLLQLSEESPVWRALESGEPVTARADAGGALRGLSNSPAAFAMAIPLVSSDRLTMILYGEHPAEPSPRDTATSESVAGIIADHISSRLKRKAAASDVPAGDSQTPVRRARRIRLREGTTVDIDGTEGQLVDLSLIGAQVLSARAMKPNRTVRLILPGDREGVSAQARVVWALVEPTPDQRKSRYRAGVQFTEVNASELEAFFAEHGFSKHDIKH